MKITENIWAYAGIGCSLVLAGCIAGVLGYSPVFLSLLALNILLIVLNRQGFGAKSGAVVRTLVGCVFIFSGYVKGVDPIGTHFIIHDYLEAYQMPWLVSLALPLSFLLNLVEFGVGCLLVCNVWTKWTTYLAALMMAFFTVVTFFDAIANPVPDCGCFGEALILTNWQTFYKNLVLDALVLALIFALPKLGKGFCGKAQAGIAAGVVLLFLGFEIYNYRHLPVSNFLGWKDGRRMLVENPEPIRYYLTYRDKETGALQEYRDKEIPFSDTAWNNRWEFVSRRDEDPNPRIIEVSLLERVDDEDGGYDVTDAVIGREGLHFLVVVYDWEKASEKTLTRIWEKLAEAGALGYGYDLLVATDSETPVSDMEAFKEKVGDAELAYYFGDDTGLKSMIRANPGVILMDGPVVVKRWNGRDFPDLKSLKHE